MDSKMIQIPEWEASPTRTFDLTRTDSSTLGRSWFYIPSLNRYLVTNTDHRDRYAFLEIPNSQLCAVSFGWTNNHVVDFEHQKAADFFMWWEEVERSDECVVYMGDGEALILRARGSQWISFLPGLKHSAYLLDRDRLIVSLRDGSRLEIGPDDASNPIAPYVFA